MAFAPHPLEPGDSAPTFQLPDMLQQNTFSSSAMRGTLTVVVFWSAECHWCQHLADFFRERSTTWKQQGVRLLLVASNSQEKNAALVAKAQAIGYSGHLLRDSDQAIADAFGAITTPHSFIIDRGGTIVYQGGVNDRTFHSEPTINYLDEALASLQRGTHPEPAETPAYGCAIVRRLS